ncbi:MAG TPA: NAD-dependent epimerase/dehydratase family protein [Clostridia bacterium]|nr:NAD-dependent epimerase/dehydratase family protein [Clostridia bacterium]
MSIEKGVHVVLGANGAVGQAVVKELQNYLVEVRQVGRTEKSVKGYFKADITDSEQLKKVFKNCKVAYLCAGVAYSSKLWASEWPKIIDSVIEALKGSETKLVYLDNIYLYGPMPLENPIKETHLRKPVSKKGRARLSVVERLESEEVRKNLNWVIGRSADFFGPNAKSSLFADSFIGNMWKDTKPYYIGSAGVVHTYSYVPDIARALVNLAFAETKSGETYHLPVYSPMIVEDVVKEVNSVMNKSLEVNAMSKGSHSFLRLFVPALKELYEMRYQFDHPYVLDDSKFRKQFPDFKQTDFKDAMKETVLSLKQG